MIKITPSSMIKLNTIFEIAKKNDTIQELFHQFDGVDANEAFRILKGLDDRQHKVLAALIGNTNEKFDRKKEA